MKITQLLLPILLITLLGTSNINAQTEISIERDQILWSSGHWGPPGINNPAHSLSASWESKFMYDILFDWNSVLDEPLVGFLGKTMEWSADGKNINIVLREEAKWSDGESINSEDVVYSFNEIYAAKNGPLNASFTEKIQSVVTNGDYGVIVTVNEGFEFSKSVFFQFIGRWQIMPSHIWPDVMEYEMYAGNNKYQMTVNWLEPSFPDELKVASGMYFPHSQAVDGSWSLYERNDDWWGFGVLSDKLPDPKYIGMKSYPSNFAQNSEFISGEIDWFGGYIQNIGAEIDRNPYLSTYFGNNDPYFPSLSSIVEVVPNHEIYPLSEHWFREAIAYGLNVYDMIDIGASGYLEPARVARIDDRSSLLADLYDPTIEEQYGFSYDENKANEILNENAIKQDGVWYTKDTPEKFQDDLTDSLPNVDGFNVQIGPYDLKTVIGWSDFELHADTLQKQLAAIDIEINVQNVEYADFVGASNSMNYEILLYGLGPGLMDGALAMFNYFTGPAGRGVNTTGWYNPTYVEYLNQFEVAIQGSDEEKELATKLQEEIARDLPSIPLFANGYWYSFNTQYWDGWPTEATNVMPPLAMWGFGSTGLLQQLLWSLNQNVGQTLPAVTSGTNNSELTETNDGAFSNIFITASVIISTIIIRKRLTYRL
jgi:peptide/nickel transport system substrate-binding protein|tara:strand:+ start:3453 stop:5411 length:1959 start_codon:yes stop_codon:yes gene_type:complete